MSLPACASTRPTVFRAIAAGSTRPDTSTPIDFTSAFCSTYNIKRWPVDTGCSNVPTTFLLSTRFAQYIRDAGIVFVHRDPLAVLPSVARLTEVLRRPFTRHVDRIEIGRQDSDRWLAATKLMTEAADEEQFEEPILHIHYLNLVSDPLEHRGDALSAFRAARSIPRTAARISRLVAAKPNGGYGTRRSHMEEYELNPVAERDRYAQYVERFGIRPERRAGAAKLVKSSAALVSGRSAEAAEKVSPANPRGDTIASDRSTRCAT